MPVINTLKQLFHPARQPESDPAEAYDIWAESYDNQPDNLMLALDEALCRELLATLPLTGRTIVDIGCGTGRHWPALFNGSPARVLGYDVSRGMLNCLQKKYPRAETNLLSGVTLTGLADNSCDVVLSTLTVAHLPDLAAALTEWNRVLKPGGDMLITDYHPTALAKGGQRTFRDGERLIAVRNHLYPVPRLLGIAYRLGLTEITLTERKIDETMRPWYEQQNSLPVFRRFLGIPIIYGLHLKKPDAAQ
ncbi:MAG TPA: class I SAM-dependent methyltransferase [Puia sp.]|nr:class I SAM-dependent methyltransferase [Puia sp.]